MEIPIEYDEIVLVVDKAKIGSVFKKDVKNLLIYFDSLNENEKQQLYKAYNDNLNHVSIKVDSQVFEIDKKWIEVKSQKAMKYEERVIPNVIEPSFGIGRILHCVLEHCIKVREEDERRLYFSFAPSIAPYKVSVLPLLSNNNDLILKANEIHNEFLKNYIPSLTESNNSIGKRYSKMDEIGV